MTSRQNGFYVRDQVRIPDFPMATISSFFVDYACARDASSVCSAADDRPDVRLTNGWTRDPLPRDR